MEEKKPEGWFVRTEVGHKGDVQFQVRKFVVETNEYGVPTTKLEQDLVIAVPYEIPWWQFWQLPFADRLREANEAAKKRAWELNERTKLAGQITYNLGHPPHA